MGTTLRRSLDDFLHEAAPVEARETPHEKRRSSLSSHLPASSRVKSAGSFAIGAYAPEDSPFSSHVPQSARLLRLLGLKSAISVPEHMQKSKPPAELPLGFSAPGTEHDPSVVESSIQRQFMGRQAPVRTIDPMETTHSNARTSGVDLSPESWSSAEACQACQAQGPRNSPPLAERPPPTPNGREAPPRAPSIDRDSGRSLSRASSGVASAKAALEDLIHSSVPVYESGMPGGLKLIKLSSLSPAQLDATSPRGECFTSHQKSLSGMHPHGLRSFSRCSEEGRQPPDCMETESAVAEPGNGEERLVQPDEFSDDEASSRLNLSLLSKADSDDLESVRNAAAAEPTVRRARAGLTDAPAPRDPSSTILQRSMPEIQPEPASSRAKPPGWRSSASNVLNLLPTSPKSSTQRTQPGHADLQTHQAFRDVLPRRGQALEEQKTSPSRCSDRSSQIAAEQHKRNSRYIGPEIICTSPGSPDKQVRRIPARHAQTAKRALSLTPQITGPKQAFAARQQQEWQGLGKTQAALAQLEWQNRRLTREATGLRQRAVEAETAVSRMADADERCTKLSQDNDRLLKRLLLLVSPSEAKRMDVQGAADSAELEAEVARLLEKNKRLEEENAVLQQDVEALTSAAGGCLLCKYLSQRELAESRLEGSA